MSIERTWTVPHAAHRFQQSGYPRATKRKIWWLLRTGKIDPPHLDWQGRYLVSDTHIAQIVRYLDNPPPPGRPARKNDSP